MVLGDLKDFMGFPWLYFNWLVVSNQLKHSINMLTLQETNISPKNGILKMIFLFPRWDMLIPWRVSTKKLVKHTFHHGFIESPPFAM